METTYDERHSNARDGTPADGRCSARLTLALALSWLVFLAFPVITSLAVRPQWAGAGRWLAAVVGLMLVVGLYGWAVTRAISAPKRPVGWSAPTVCFGALGALALVLPLAFGAAWFGGFLYPCLLAGLLLSPRHMIWAVVIFTVGGMVLGSVVGVVWWETIALTLLTGLGGALMLGVMWLRATNAELRAAQSEIARLATASERLRLARDLHDSVKQHVFVTAMEIGAARALVGRDPGAVAIHLDRADMSIREAQGELVAMIHQPGKPRLAGRSLADALRDYLSDWSRQTAICAEERLGANSAPLPATVSDAVYRVAQEALANVARHSQATQVVVTLTANDETQTLRIWDNGCGFVPDAVALTGETRGYGLCNMRERLAAINGSLTIESRLGQGTCVTCIYPVSIRLSPQAPA